MIIFVELTLIRKIQTFLANFEKNVDICEWIASQSMEFTGK
jgi:hypothetical protein